MPNNDLSTYTTKQLESMLAKMKTEKANKYKKQEKNKTGSTLNKQEIANIQKKLNKGAGRFPSPLDKYRKKKE
mgnify:FL=1|tara:strand:+ start:1834 stop:2052 length:219 start_codon:yes stop_codon:yes gene_type:complete